MEQYSTSVMIALLPTTTDWCNQAHPHMTLVYAGKIEDLKGGDHNELAKDAAALAMMNEPLSLRVKGVDVFGGGEDELVDVFKLEPNEQLLAMRRTVEQWNASEHDFEPHVTIGPRGQYLAEPPSYLTFDKICVGWGNDYLTFLMRR